jgi:hypothetical protein
MSLTNVPQLAVGVEHLRWMAVEWNPFAHLRPIIQKAIAGVMCSGRVNQGRTLGFSDSTLPRACEIR